MSDPVTNGLWQYRAHPDCPNGEHEQQPHTYQCRHCSAVNMWHMKQRVEPDYEAAHKELDLCVAMLRRKAFLHPDDYKQMMDLFARSIVDAALGVDGE